MRPKARRIISFITSLAFSVNMLTVSAFADTELITSDPAEDIVLQNSEESTADNTISAEEDASGTVSDESDEADAEPEKDWDSIYAELEERSAAAFADIGPEGVFVELSDDELECLRQSEQGFVPVSESGLYDGDVSNAITEYSSNWFYDQLSTDEEDLYDQLYTICLHIERSSKDYTDASCGEFAYYDKTKITYSRAKMIVKLFYYDNPQFYFLVNGWYGYEGGFTPYIHTNFRTASARTQYASDIDDIVTRWMADINLKGSQLTRQKIIYTKICENTVYDGSGSNHQSIAGCLVDKKCVCNGYALTNQLLCNMAGIECITICSSDHAWNIVNLNGDWFNEDVTWMDQDDWGIWDIWLNRSTEKYKTLGNYSSHTPIAEYNDFILPSCVLDEVGNAPSTSGLRDITVIQPEKIFYAPGEELVIDDLELRLDYNDYTSEYIPVTADMISGYNPYVPGTYDIAVTYGGLTDTFEVTVGDGLSIKSAEIDTASLKTVYSIGDSLDVDGGKLVITYSDDSTISVDLTEDMVTGFDSTTSGSKNLTVSFYGLTAGYTVTVNSNITVLSAVILGGYKTEFYSGDSIDIIGKTLRITYSNGNIENVIITADMVSGFNSSVGGTQTVTVSHNGSAVLSYSVNVTADIITSLDIEYAYKTEYYTGQDLDIIGKILVVNYQYSAPVRVVITSDMVSGFDNTRSGLQIIKVSYGGSVYSYNITVIQLKLSTIDIVTASGGEPKTAYFENETLDILGGTLTLTFNDGSTIIRTINSSMVSGFDSTKTGDQTVTVDYAGYSASYTVTVTAIRAVSLTILGGTYKTAYYTGDALDIIGRSMDVVLNNGGSERVTITSDMITGFNSNIAGNQIVTVNYRGGTFSYNVTVTQLVITKLEIVDEHKTTFYTGDSIDLVGKRLRATYNNGRIDHIYITEDMISGFDSTTPGTQTVTVTYAGKTTSYSINMIQLAVSTLAIDYDYKTEYYTGDALDIIGKDLIVKYNNGAIDFVTITAAMVSGYYPNRTGAQHVTVSYGGAVTGYDITVAALAVESIEIDDTYSTVYYTGDDIDLIGKKLKIHYNNGTTGNINITAGMISGFNSSTAGDKTVTVTYEGKTFSYDIVVIPLTIADITIEGGYRTKFYVGEYLDIVGRKLIVRYNSGEVVYIPITLDMVSGFNSSIPGNQTVIIKHNGAEIMRYNVAVEAVAVTSVGLIKTPKTEYYVGDELDISGAKIKVFYNNGVNETVDVTPEMVVNFDTTTPGTKTVRISYGGKNAEYTIVVTPLVVVRIYITSMPKQAYYTGDALSVEGGQIAVEYNSGRVSVIRMAEEMISGFDTSKAGTKKLGVSYSGASTTYTITVTQLKINNIVLYSLPKTEYYLYDDIDLTTGSISVEYNDTGRVEIIPLNDQRIKVTGFDSTKVGTRNLTVSYGGKTLTIPYTVSVDPLNAPYLLNGVPYAVFSDALKNIKQGGTYTLEVNVDTATATITIPAASSVTLVTRKNAVITTSSINASSNLILDADLVPQKTASPVNVKVSNGKNLTVKGGIYGTLTGSRTSTLFITNDTIATGISTFGNVNVSDLMMLTVTGSMTGVDEFTGMLDLPGTTASNSAVITRATDATIILTHMGLGSDGKYKLPKVTVSYVTGTLTAGIFDSYDNAIRIPEGQPVIYDGGKENFAGSIRLVNKTYYHDDHISAYLINKAYCAEYSEALILECSNPKISGHYPSLDLLFSAITSDNNYNKTTTETYTIKLMCDLSLDKFNLPANAGAGIVFDGCGNILTLPGVATIAPKYSLKFYDLTFRNINYKTGASVSPTFTIAANRSLVFESVLFTMRVKSISGSTTSVLMNDCVLTTEALSGIGTVVANDKLFVTDKATSLGMVTGILILTNPKSTQNSIKQAAKLDLRLAKGDIDKNGFITIPKVSISEVLGGIDYTIVDSTYENAVRIPESQPILTLSGKEDYAGLITIKNETYEHSDNIKAFLYSKEYRAQYANSLNLYCSNDAISRNYPNFETLFAAITSDTAHNKDQYEYYEITLLSDHISEKFALPANAGGTIVFNGNSHSLTLPGLSSLSFKNNAVFSDITLRNINTKTGADVALAISASKSLVLDRFVSSALKSLSGSNKQSLYINDSLVSCATISGFEYADIATSVIRATQSFSIANVKMTSTRLVAAAKAAVTINKSLQSYDSEIALEKDFKPITLGGTTTGTIKLTSTYPVAEGTQILNSKTADLDCFDISAIVPADGVEYALIRSANTKVTVNGYKLSVGGRKFAFWSDMITAIEKNEVYPDLSGTYNAVLLSDMNIGNKLTFPKNKPFALTSDECTLAFTGFSAPTASLYIYGTDLMCLNNQGKEAAYTISAANNSTLRLEDTDLGMATAITGTRSDIVLDDVVFSGNITADTLAISGTLDGVLNGLTANTVYTNNTALRFLEKKTYKVSREVVGNLSIEIVNAQGYPVALPAGTTVVFSQYGGTYTGNITVTNYGVIRYCQKDSTRLVIKI